MKTCLTLILLFAVSFTAGPALGKTFYLRDGSSIEYKKVWKQGDQIFVLVNRDTLVDFSPDEVDQRKTLKAAGLKKFPRLTIKKRKPAPAAEEESAATARPTVDDTGKPVVYNGALATAAVSDSGKKGRGAASRNGMGRGEGLSQELVAIYESLHNAMKSGNLEGVRRNLSSRNVSSMGAKELALIETGISLMPPNRTITGSSTSPDGTRATLKMSARTNSSDPKPDAVGTISFVREEGSWKLDQENWAMQVQ